MKWGWYATIVELARNDINKIEKVLKKNVHEVHIFLAHKIDKQKLKAQIMRNGNNANVTQL